MAKAANSPSYKGKQKEVDASASPGVSNVKDPKPSSSAPKAKKPEKIKLRRIHVSGLPDITEQEAKDRFKSFGEVTGVDGLGKLDATGAMDQVHDIERDRIPTECNNSVFQVNHYDMPLLTSKPQRVNSRNVSNFDNLPYGSEADNIIDRHESLERFCVERVDTTYCRSEANNTREVRKVYSILV